MPHTFIKSHSMRNSCNGAKPYNHKAMRTHTKSKLNKYSMDEYEPNPNFFVGTDNCFPKGIDTRYWDDCNIDNCIVHNDYEMAFCKEMIEELKDSTNTEDLSYYEERLKELNKINDGLKYSYDLHDAINCEDYSIPHKMARTSTTHRTSREKSLPTERLARHIKKQVFFKKSRKVEKEFQPIRMMSSENFYYDDFFSYPASEVTECDNFSDFNTDSDDDDDYDDDYDYLIAMYYDYY